MTREEEIYENALKVLEERSDRIDMLESKLHSMPINEFFERRKRIVRRIEKEEDIMYALVSLVARVFDKTTEEVWMGF